MGQRTNQVLMIAIGLVLVAITGILFPAPALADNLRSCIIIGNPNNHVLAVVEGPQDVSRDGVSCHLPEGWAAPDHPMHFRLVEPPGDPEFDPHHPISDYFNVTPGGEIQLVSDPRVPNTGLCSPQGCNDFIDVPETTPTIIHINGVTYQVYSEGSPMPEPGTLALFGGGLLAIGVLIRRRLSA